VLVILSLIGGSFTLYQNASSFQKRRVAEKALQYDLHRAQELIQVQMGVYVNGLYSVRSLFTMHSSVTRLQFYEFVKSMDVLRQYPALSGFGYAKIVQQDEKEVFIATVRADKSVSQNGYPNFQMFPSSAVKKESYMVLTYIEPMLGREESLGFDISSDPERKKTFEHARDNNYELATGKVDAVNQSGVQSILITLPIYKKGAPVRTFNERRAAFVGIVNASFRTEELFGTLFPKSVIAALERIEIFDGKVLDDEHLLFDSEPELVDTSNSSWISATSEFEVAHKTWTIRLSRLSSGF